MITEERFKQLWDTAIGSPSSTNKQNDACTTNGMSTKLANAIVAASREGRSLAIKR